jgi:hypothetical protein
MTSEIRDLTIIKDAVKQCPERVKERGGVSDSVRSIVCPVNERRVNGDLRRTGKPSNETTAWEIKRFPCAPVSINAVTGPVSPK